MKGDHSHHKYNDEWKKTKTTTTEEEEEEEEEEEVEEEEEEEFPVWFPVWSDQNISSVANSNRNPLTTKLWL